MSLFENDRDANRESSIAMIEAVLTEMGRDPASVRSGSAQEPRWRIPHGSTTVTISLVERDDYIHLRVAAPVMTTDARVDVLKLYRHLLALHATEVHGAAFAAHQNEIQIVSERSTIDLDPSEVRDTLLRVSRYADKYDDLLVEQFGGRPGGVD